MSHFWKTRHEDTAAGITAEIAELTAFVDAAQALKTDTKAQVLLKALNLGFGKMATLYDVDVRTVNEHLKKIFADGELVEGEPTIRKFRIVQDEGGRQVSRDTWHYNLQASIAVGFKVNNPRAVQFRKWAGQIVKDYTIQGWTMDVECLKKGHLFTGEYFERQQAVKAGKKAAGKKRSFHQELVLNRWVLGFFQGGTLGALKLRLASQAKAGEAPLVLNAFVLSPTKFAGLLNVGDPTKKADLESRNVLFMEDGGATYRR